MIPITVDTIRGPWFSLGVHIDFQRPCLDLHFGWWIITIGRGYELPYWHDDDDDSICPECGALWQSGDHGSMVTSIDNDLLDDMLADWPEGGAP